MRSSKERKKKNCRGRRKKQNKNSKGVFFSLSLSHALPPLRLLLLPPPPLSLTSALRAALSAGADPNEVEAAGNTPLHSAAFEGWAEGVEALLRAGAKPLASNNAGDRAWHWATTMGHDAVADLLARACPGGLAAAEQQGKVIVQDHVPKVKEFFAKPCWAHHPKPYKDFIEARRRSDAALRAAASADGAGLLPGL